MSTETKGQAAAKPALFAHYPRLERQIPRVDLGVLVTPIDRLALADGAVAWVKRDDHAARAYGGNKVRKLEFVLGEAMERSAGHLVTSGALGSHHALATSIYGTKLGLPTTAVLFPQPVTPHVRDVLGAHARLRTTLRSVRRMELIPLGVTLARLRHRRSGIYVVPPGGSNVAGTLGFVSAGLELADQVAAGECPQPAAVYVAAGTLGTVAGLAIGLRLASLASKVVAVRVVGGLVTNQWALRRLIRATLARLAEHGVAAPSLEKVFSSIEWRDTEVGRGYGLPTEAGHIATERFRPAGIVLDPTYTAKAAAALLYDLGRGRAGPLLFWHTLSFIQPQVHPAPGEVLPPGIMALLRAND